MNRRRRTAAVRLGVVIGVAAVSIVFGLLVGMAASKGGDDGAAKEAGGGEDVWYTCGMHPEVMQDEPGMCPQCNMKLTPIPVGKKPGEDASGGPEERKVLYWRAPMDTGYVSDRPGKSPMGMDLVPVYAGEGETVTGDGIRIDPRTIQNMGLRTERIRRGPLVKIIRTLGRVDYDEQRVVFVDTKFSGWIRKLQVDKTGQPVAAGQPLFAIYSPQLFQAQQEFLSAIEKLPELEKSPLADARDDARKMVEAARAKLALYDISADQIDALAESMQPSQTMTIVSPADGIVTDKMALQGMAVKPGMRLYTIADLSRVWVYLDIYEYQLPWIKVGQDATMTLA